MVLARNSLETTIGSNCTGTENKKPFILKRVHNSKGKNEIGTQNMVNKKCPRLSHILNFHVNLWLGFGMVFTSHHHSQRGGTDKGCGRTDWQFCSVLNKNLTPEPGN